MLRPVSAIVCSSTQLGEQADEEQQDASSCHRASAAQKPAPAGDDRDRRQHDSNLEANLGQLVVEVLSVGVIGLVFVGVDLGAQVSIGGLQLLGDSRLVSQRLAGGAPHLRAAHTERLQQSRVAAGDVDLDPIALQPRRGVGSVSLTGDYLLHRLVGEKGRQGEEGGHHGYRERSVPPVVRPTMVIGCCGDPVPLLEPLI